jgi:hypothetical protein
MSQVDVAPAGRWTLVWTFVWTFPSSRWVPNHRQGGQGRRSRRVHVWALDLDGPGTHEDTMDEVGRTRPAWMHLCPLALVVVPSSGELARSC